MEEVIYHISLSFYYLEFLSVPYSRLRPMIILITMILTMFIMVRNKSINSLMGLLKILIDQLLALFLKLFLRILQK